jgi:hypothetical protein
MNEASKFKIPARKPVDPAMLEKFAAGAEQGSDAGLPAPSVAVATSSTVAPTPTAKLPELNDKPWIGLDDKKRMPAFSMRLTAAEQAKLKYLSNHTPDSMHEICLKATRERIEQLLKELGNNQTM